MVLHINQTPLPFLLVFFTYQKMDTQKYNQADLSAETPFIRHASLEQLEAAYIAALESPFLSRKDGMAYLHAIQRLKDRQTTAPYQSQNIQAHHVQRVTEIIDRRDSKSRVAIIYAKDSTTETLMARISQAVFGTTTPFSPQK